MAPKRRELRWMYRQSRSERGKRDQYLGRSSGMQSVVPWARDRARRRR